MKEEKDLFSSLPLFETYDEGIVSVIRTVHFDPKMAFLVHATPDH